MNQPSPENWNLNFVRLQTLNAAKNESILKVFRYTFVVQLCNFDKIVL